MEWNTKTSFPDAFHEVAANLYADDPHWIPESSTEWKQKFASSNRYFENAKAWLDVTPGKARLAGFFDPTLTIDNARVAYFGYWETNDELNVNRRMFQDFERWAAAQGATKVYGPINFTTFNSYRIRLDSFDKGGFPGEPYNKPYYAALLDSLGYQLCVRYYSIFSSLQSILPRIQKPMRRLQQRIDGKFFFEPLTASYWMNRLDDFYRLVDIAFSANMAYSKIQFECFARDYGATLANRFSPYSSVVAVDHNDDIAGFLILLPDYSPLLRQGARHLIAASDLNYEQHYPLLQNPRFLAKTTGVHPRYRGKGLMQLMTYFTFNASANYCETIGGVLMREDNSTTRLNRLLVPQHEAKTHGYGLFAKTL